MKSSNGWITSAGNKFLLYEITQSPNYQITKSPPTADPPDCIAGYCASGAENKIHMKHRVTGKQQNSKMCFLCGLKNSFGLKGEFFELENNELVCIFKPSNEHQSYPGRLHGGITTAVLDETIGRAIMIKSKEEVWGVTVEFTTRFKKQIPLNEELRVVGRITIETSRTFEGTGELLLPNGEVAATGFGKYLRMPLNKISDFDPLEQEWKVVHSEKDPETIEL